MKSHSSEIHDQSFPIPAQGDPQPPSLALAVLDFEQLGSRRVGICRDENAELLRGPKPVRLAFKVGRPRMGVEPGVAKMLLGDCTNPAQRTSSRWRHNGRAIHNGQHWAQAARRMLQEEANGGAHRLAALSMPLRAKSATSSLGASAAPPPLRAATPWMLPRPGNVATCCCITLKAQSPLQTMPPGRVPDAKPHCPETTASTSA